MHSICKTNPIRNIHYSRTHSLPFSSKSFLHSPSKSLLYNLMLSAKILLLCPSKLFLYNHNNLMFPSPKSPLCQLWVCILRVLVLRLTCCTEIQPERVLSLSLAPEPASTSPDLVDIAPFHYKRSTYQLTAELEELYNATVPPPSIAPPPLNPPTQQQEVPNPVALPHIQDSPPLDPLIPDHQEPVTLPPASLAQLSQGHCNDTRVVVPFCLTGEEGAEDRIAAFDLVEHPPGVCSTHPPTNQLPLLH